MNIAVCMKQTADTETRLKIAGDGTSIVEDDIQWIINPYDESAIEQALLLAEAEGGEVTVIAIGPERIEKSIREALAMGAHNAIRLDCDKIPDDALVIAKALVAVLKEDAYDIIFAGQQAVDNDNAQVPQRIATALGLPCVTAVEELALSTEGGTAMRLLEGARETTRFSLPAVIGVNLRLAKPRYPSFKGIMQAKRKPIDVRPANLEPAKLAIRKLTLPPQKTAGKLFENGAEAIPEVLRLLREEAKVL